MKLLLEKVPGLKKKRSELGTHLEVLDFVIKKLNCDLQLIESKGDLSRLVEHKMITYVDCKGGSYCTTTEDVRFLLTELEKIRPLLQ